MSQIDLTERQTPQPETKRPWYVLLWNPYTSTAGTAEAERLARYVYRFVIISWILICTVWAIHVARNLAWKLHPGQAGQFGDTFGSINALFSGLALAGVSYAIILQHRELEEARSKSIQDEKDRIEKMRIDQRTSMHQAEQSLSALLTAKLNSRSTMIASFSQLLTSASLDAEERKYNEALLKLHLARLQNIESEFDARYSIARIRTEDRATGNPAKKVERTQKALLSACSKYAREVSQRMLKAVESYKVTSFPYSIYEYSDILSMEVSEVWLFVHRESWDVQYDLERFSVYDLWEEMIRDAQELAYLDSGIDEKDLGEWKFIRRDINYLTALNSLSSHFDNLVNKIILRQEIPRRMPRKRSSTRDTE